MTKIPETPRLLLRQMTEADAGALFAVAHNPDVTRYILPEPALTSREQALTVLRARVLSQ
jgi:RimJ/RimL family protein N-acetyltransferase